MEYKFKVTRRTVSFDDHTVIIDASSEYEARNLVENGLGNYCSLDRDEIEDAEIIEVTRKNSH